MGNLRAEMIIQRELNLQVSWEPRLSSIPERPTLEAIETDPDVWMEETLQDIIKPWPTGPSGKQASKTKSMIGIDQSRFFPCSTLHATWTEAAIGLRNDLSCLNASLCLWA